MSGLYGTVRPANIDLAHDVEILYFYRPSRSVDDENFTTFKKGDPSWLVQSEDDDARLIMGLYNLRLPLDIFNKVGFYTVYIRPKEVRTEIHDVSVLAVSPDTKGVVFDTNKFGGEIGDSDLSGYRIDYLDESGSFTNISRLITSCNKAEPVTVSSSDSYSKGVKYAFTDSSSNFLFCTVTPSSALSFKPNVTPFIGTMGGQVVLSNTKFNPVMLELEMVEHDIETVTNMLEGDQVRNRDKGMITTFTKDKEIYIQQDYYTVKDALGNPLYDVKRTRTNIDGDESYDNTIDNV